MGDLAGRGRLNVRCRLVAKGLVHFLLVVCGQEKKRKLIGLCLGETSS